MTTEFEMLLEGMRRAGAALRDAGVPFALAGSLATWARGGTETDHDVDFVLKPRDAERALDALAAAGFRCERPPENWLYKAYDEFETLIDLIFAPNNVPVDDALLDRADVFEVYAVELPVLAAGDVLATMLLALGEHRLDYDRPLGVARSLREQIDWEYVRGRTCDSPYARAFVVLAEELGIAA